MSQGGLNIQSDQSNEAENEENDLQARINSIEQQRIVAHTAWKYRVHEFINEINNLSQTLVSDLNETLKWKQDGVEEAELEARSEIDKLRDASKKLAHIDCFLKSFTANANNYLGMKLGNNEPNKKINRPVYDLTNLINQENVGETSNEINKSHDEKAKSTVHNSNKLFLGESTETKKDQVSSFFSQNNHRKQTKSNSTFVNTIENM